MNDEYAHGRVVLPLHLKDLDGMLIKKKPLLNPRPETPGLKLPSVGPWSHNAEPGLIQFLIPQLVQPPPGKENGGPSWLRGVKGAISGLCVPNRTASQWYASQRRRENGVC